MSLADDLRQLADLHQRGQLSDDEFQRAKARLIDPPAAAHPAGSGAGHSAQAMINGLRRSRQDRWLGGVCGGIAEITGVASWFWRGVFVLLLMFAGTGGLVYLLAWLLLPEADGPVVAMASGTGH